MRLEKKFNSLWIHRSWEFDLQKGSNGFGGGDIDIDDDYGCPAYSHHDDDDDDGGNDDHDHDLHGDDDDDDINHYQVGPCKSQ